MSWKNSSIISWSNLYELTKIRKEYFEYKGFYSKNIIGPNTSYYIKGAAKENLEMTYGKGRKEHCLQTFTISKGKRSWKMRLILAPPESSSVSTWSPDPSILFSKSTANCWTILELRKRNKPELKLVKAPSLSGCSCPVLRRGIA